MPRAAAHPSTLSKLSLSFLLQMFKRGGLESSHTISPVVSADLKRHGLLIVCETVQVPATVYRRSHKACRIVFDPVKAGEVARNVWFTASEGYVYRDLLAD